MLCLNTLLMLALGLCLASFSACSTLDSSEKVTLRLSTWGSSEEIAVMKSLLQAFEQQHPEIEVKLIHIPENYFQKLHILIAGDLAPDVMFINSLSLPVYAENNTLKPLGADLATSGEAKLSATTFFPSALTALSWNNQLYALPRDISNLVVFYNQDLFQQANVPVPSADWTFETMLQRAQQLTRDMDGDDKPDQFGISFMGKPPLFWLPFVWSQGANLFGADLKTFQLDTPQALEALQFYADLRHRWHVAPTRQDVGNASMSQLFLQGKLAMMVSGRWSVPVFREQAQFQWDIAPFPKGKAGSVVGIDASGYAISNTTPYPKESWALVQFLSSQPAQQAFSQSGLIVPARKDVANDPAFLQAPPAHGRYFIEALSTGYPTHTPVRWNEISEELGLALEPVWEGTLPAKTAIQKAAPKIETLLQ